jgi:glucokinase
MKKTQLLSVVGVDIGGTYVRVGIVHPSSGRIFNMSKFRTSGLTLTKFCAMLEDAIRPFRDKVSKIGIAIPGFCDSTLRQAITTAGVVPFLEGCDLAKAVEKRLSVRTILDNDARAHLRGEFHYGRWGRPQSLVVMTLGTGVGLAWQIEGRLYPPPDHGAMAGHMIVEGLSGRLCFCGAAGCLESLASGTALAATANERLGRFVPSKLRSPVSSEDVCAHGRNDHVARECIARAAEALRCALHNVYHFYFPDIVVLGGGLAPSLWPYLGGVRRWFNQVERYDGRRSRLAISRLGDKAGILGAAALAASAENDSH